MCKRKEKPPEHMANCLYLEWFSEANGRVVIESADYELTISAPEWRLTPEENEERAETGRRGHGGFHAEAHRRHRSSSSAARRTRRSPGTSTITRSS